MEVLWGEMTVFRDPTEWFLQPTHTQPCCFHLWVYIPTHLPLSHPFCSHWTKIPRTLLEVTSQIVCGHIVHAIQFKAAWRVMVTLDIWADTKSCWDISYLGMNCFLVRPKTCPLLAEQGLHQITSLQGYMLLTCRETRRTESLPSTGESYKLAPVGNHTWHTIAQT